MSNTSTSVNLALTQATRALKKSSHSPELDSMLLLAYTLNTSKEFILSHTTNILSAKELKLFNELISRRARGEPIAYITGHKEFFGLDFIVTPDVLIPRPETEGLVELVLAYLPATYAPPPTLIDIGTGSGCIAVTLAKERPGTRIIATDVSKKALAIARKNAQIHQTEKQIAFLHSDLLFALPSFDILIANLPYLTDKQISENPSLTYEPRTALAGGANGFALFKQLVYQIKKMPHPPEAIFLEIDPAQAGDLKSTFAPLGIPRLHRDLRGDIRYLEVMRLAGVPGSPPTR